ncbi:hypothetical protein SAMN05216345_12524 [Cupriavidus sp. YR651]|nr:hypothetical protein SAMN05216345_12524 [Cupriavidus sp. YR651]
MCQCGRLAHKVNRANAWRARHPASTGSLLPNRRNAIADDKGGIAVILHALEILKAKGWSDYAQLTVLLNSDGEAGSVGSGETELDSIVPRLYLMTRMLQEIGRQ